MTQRVLPHNLDAEASVLGGILLRNDAIRDVGDLLEPEDFYDPRHREVFAAMLALESSTRPIDTLTLEEELKRTGRLVAIGGLGFLSELLGRVSTADNIRHHAAIVRDKSLALRLIQTCSGIVAQGFGDYGTAEEYLSEAMGAVLALAHRQPDSSVLMSDLVRETFREWSRLADAASRGEQVQIGLPTGFGDYDFALGGGLPNGLIIIGGRPSHGKSSFARSIAWNVSELLGATGGVHVFSLEDERRAYAMRCLADGGGVDLHRFRTLNLHRNDIQGLMRAADRLSRLRNWRIDDVAGLTSTQIAMRVRRHRRDLNTRLVVVDYLQLVREEGKDRRAQVEKAVINLAELARSEGVPVLLLSQLTRANARENRPPELYDLRESGEIEQVAKVVAFVWQQDGDNGVGGQVIVRKNKDGRRDVFVPLDWDGPTATYRNRSQLPGGR